MRIVFGRTKPGRNVLSREELRPRYSRSLSLGHVEAFAFEMAHFRGSQTIEPRDTLGGIYVASVEFQRFTLYWKDWRSFEDLAFERCGIDGPRISYWLPPFDIGKAHGKGFYNPFGYKEESPEFRAIYSTAEDLTEHYPVGLSGGLPVLATEHVLLAMLRHPELEISQKLKDSGIDSERIEAALRSGKPLR